MRARHFAWESGLPVFVGLLWQRAQAVRWKVRQPSGHMAAGLLASLYIMPVHRMAWLTLYDSMPFAVVLATKQTSCIMPTCTDSECFVACQVADMAYVGCAAAGIVGEEAKSAVRAAGRLLLSRMA